MTRIDKGECRRFRPDFFSRKDRKVRSNPIRTIALFCQPSPPLFSSREKKSRRIYLEDPQIKVFNRATICVSHGSLNRIDIIFQNIFHLSTLISSAKMPANQSTRQQKRSRLSDAAPERSARSNEERLKRRRVSETNETESLQQIVPANGSKEGSNSHAQMQDVEAKQKSPASWSFSRPVGGRYNNLDPILTDDEA